MSAQIPDTHLDLLTGPIFATLTTLSPSGAPENTIVWCSWDGTHVLVNTAEGRRKPKNVRANPKVALMALDPRRCIPLDRCAWGRRGNRARPGPRQHQRPCQDLRGSRRVLRQRHAGIYEREGRAGDLQDQAAAGCDISSRLTCSCQWPTTTTHCPLESAICQVQHHDRQPDPSLRPCADPSKPVTQIEPFGVGRFQDDLPAILLPRDADGMQSSNRAPNP